MADTIAVLALDAADYRLLREWNCENLLLDNHGPLESYAYTYEYPHTSEVWPTVATGLGPEEHGITPTSAHSDWQNPFLRLASRGANVVLPDTATDLLGKHLVSIGVARHVSSPSRDMVTVFDELYEWPGLSHTENLDQAWKLMRRTRAGNVTERELDTVLFRNTREELLWLASRSGGLVGTHAHVLDVMGHTYCRREAELRSRYERVNEMVPLIRDGVDEFVILSDHGMQVSWLDDEKPGEHSWDAYIASTLDDDLPETVFDVAGWLENHRPMASDAEAGEDRPAISDTAAETLENLYGIDVGYDR